MSNTPGALAQPPPLFLPLLFPGVLSIIQPASVPTCQCHSTTCSFSEPHTSTCFGALGTNSDLEASRNSPLPSVMFASRNTPQMCSFRLFKLFSGARHVFPAVKPLCTPCSLLGGPARHNFQVYASTAEASPQSRLTNKAPFRYQPPC